MVDELIRMRFDEFNSIPFNECRSVGIPSVSLDDGRASICQRKGWAEHRWLIAGGSNQTIFVPQRARESRSRRVVLISQTW
jgi:hypothetical protein